MESTVIVKKINNNLAQLSRAGATESGGNLHLSFDQLKNTFFQYENQESLSIVNFHNESYITGMYFSSTCS